MNPIGVHALVWVGGWSANECRLAAESTRAAGYDLIEIPVLDPSSIDVADTARTLEEFELGASCSLGLGLDSDISSEDPEVVARGEAVLRDALAVATDLGSPYLGGVIYSALGKYAAPPSERGRAHCVDVLRRLAEQAGTSDVTLGIEIVNRYESNLVNTTDQALSLITDIGAPNVKVHLDTYHMNIEEPGFREPFLRCGEQLGYVHIGESHRGYLGSGTIDFDSFFAALGDVGYTGTIVFESFSSAVVAPELSNTLAIWRNTWSDGADLARAARAYIMERVGTPEAAHGTR